MRLLQINQQRFLQNLSDLAQIGRVSPADGGGLDRRPFSPAERAAREFFTQQAQAAGLEVITDAAANLSARCVAENPNAKTLLLGSHLDTVPNGGAYDGALGVMAALEAVRVVKENNLQLPVHLEAIAFTDEEGRLGDFFGSLAFIGAHTAETIDSFLTRAAAYPEDLAAMRALVPGGLTPEAILSARRNPDSLAGYVELHIEQGPRLEDAGVPIGVVDAIFGRRAAQVTFQGRSDHAGTTPLNSRADALLAASRFITQADAHIRQNFPAAVITCGNVQVTPGVYNVVSNKAVVWVEFRAAGDDELDEISQSLDELAQDITAQAGLSFSVQPVDKLQPVTMHTQVYNAICGACEVMGYEHLSFSSGAAHDAQALAAITPTGLFFVPSIGGRSHCPEEDTAADDLVAGANVLLHTALLLAQNESDTLKGT